jgi:predicted nuclease of predicted toxin-antitoxin system
VKFLFDENLSPTLVGILAREFPNCTHVRDIARAQDFMIVSKDTDFRERSYVEGFPPKIIWLDVGNAGTVVIAELLRRERQRIEDFESLQEASVLILSIGPTAI